MTAALNPYGRRFTLAQACEFLDWPESRVRRWVQLGKIPHFKTSQTVHTRRHGTKTTLYTKTGRIEFYESDLLALLARLRVEAVAPAPVQVPRSVRRPVDDECAALLGSEDNVFA